MNPVQIRPFSEEGGVDTPSPPSPLNKMCGHTHDSRKGGRSECALWVQGTPKLDRGIQAHRTQNGRGSGVACGTRQGSGCNQGSLYATQKVRIGVKTSPGRLGRLKKSERPLKKLGTSLLTQKQKRAAASSQLRSQGAPARPTMLVKRSIVVKRSLCQPDKARPRRPTNMGRRGQEGKKRGLEASGARGFTFNPRAPTESNQALPPARSRSIQQWDP